MYLSEQRLMTPCYFLPKEEKAEGKVWEVIEKCISFEQENRYTAVELMKALERIED